MNRKQIKEILDKQIGSLSYPDKAGLENRIENAVNEIYGFINNEEPEELYYDVEPEEEPDTNVEPVEFYKNKEYEEKVTSKNKKEK